MNPAEPVMLDSNIAMYAAGREHPYRLPCQRLLERVMAGDLSAVTDVEAHQEILHRYLAIGLPDKAREVSEDFQIVVPEVLPVALAEVELSRELSASYPDLPAQDLIHAAVMVNHGIRVIISADRHFDRVTEIERRDPMELALEA